MILLTQNSTCCESGVAIGGWKTVSPRMKHKPVKPNTPGGNHASICPPTQHYHLPLICVAGHVILADDSLSLSLFFAWPLEGYDLFMEDIPKKTIEIQEVSSTPINNHLWGGGFIFCVHPNLFYENESNWTVVF